jgi:hypothetical protein
MREARKRMKTSLEFLDFSCLAEGLEGARVSRQLNFRP